MKFNEAVDMRKMKKKMRKEKELNKQIAKQSSFTPSGNKETWENYIDIVKEHLGNVSKEEASWLVDALDKFSEKVTDDYITDWRIADTSNPVKMKKYKEIQKNSSGPMPYDSFFKSPITGIKYAVGCTGDD
jgi:hypothetical protein